MDMPKCMRGMMEWISVNTRKPKKKDSPILAIEEEDYFTMRALHFIDGWDGEGWYDASDEYGMSLNKDEAHFPSWLKKGKMAYWMPLPEPPEVKNG